MQFNVQKNIRGSYSVSILTYGNISEPRLLAVYNQKVLLFNANFVTAFPSGNQWCNLFLFEPAATNNKELILELEHIDKVILHTENDSLIYDNLSFCVTHHDLDTNY